MDTAGAGVAAAGAGVVAAGSSFAGAAVAAPHGTAQTFGDALDEGGTLQAGQNTLIRDCTDCTATQSLSSPVSLPVYSDWAVCTVNLSLQNVQEWQYLQKRAQMSSFPKYASNWPESRRSSTTLTGQDTSWGADECLASQRRKYLKWFKTDPSPTIEVNSINPCLCSSKMRNVSYRLMPWYPIARFFSNIIQFARIVGGELYCEICLQLFRLFHTFFNFCFFSVFFSQIHFFSFFSKYLDALLNPYY